MANANRVSSNGPQYFGNYLIASGIANTAAASNVAGTLPILSGGLSNGGAAANSGGVIIRRVTFCNPTGNISNANVSVLTSSDGNSSNAVVSNFKLTNVTAVGKWQDGNIASAYTTAELTGDVSSTLFVVVATAGATTGNVQVNVYGDVIAA